jgi:hypothetical protein
MRLILQIAGAMLSFLLGAASLVIVLIMFSLTMQIARDSLGPWFAIFASILIVVLYFVWRLLGLIFNSTAERLRRTNQRLLDRRALQATRDKRPYILYLRSFKSDDGVTLETAPMMGRSGLSEPRMFFSDVISGYAENGRRKSMDEAIYDATGYQFPIICIGDKVTTVGATRVSTNDEEWKSVFIDLANGAKAIVCVPFPSAGSLLEIEWIGQNAAQKTVFVVPDDKSVGNSDSFARFWTKSVVAFSWLGQKVPIYRAQGLIFTARIAEAGPNVWSLTPSAVRSALRSVGVGVWPSLHPIILAAYWIGLAAIVYHAAEAGGGMQWMQDIIGFLVMAGILAVIPSMVFLAEWVKFLWHFRHT